MRCASATYSRVIHSNAGSAERRTGTETWTPVHASAWQAVRVDENLTSVPAPDPLLAEVDVLVGEWRSLPDAAQLLGLTVAQVRSLLDERQLVAVRRGQPRVLSIPLALIKPEVLPALSGTLVVLTDAGFGDLEALRWLFTPDEALADTPVGQLRLGHKTEIRRRAQALAF